MTKRIIEIDGEKCNGCGQCVGACHEGAIAMENGKAKLAREDYCDGLGSCLPVCPTGAISFIERELAAPAPCSGVACKQPQSKHWPLQIKLISENAPFFDHARLLVAADCTAFACAAFHEKFVQDGVTVIGCPKLDGVDYTEKLAAIITGHPIKELVVARMEVPCCAGLAMFTAQALRASGKTIPAKVVIISTDGNITGEEEL